MSLHRSLKLSDAILLVVGNVVGAGIFTTSGFLAGELPQPFWFVGIWIIGGLLTLCGALTYAELAGLFPRAGGDYQFLKETYGAWAGFLLGWVNFWIIIPGSVAALTLALVSYLKPFLPGVAPGSERVLALAVIALFTWINYRGIRWGSNTQDVFTLGALSLIGVFVFGGVVFGKGSWQHFSGNTGGPISWTKLFASPMIAVIFTYSGWFASAYVGSEVRDPEKNVPRSLLWGTLIVTVLYTLMNITYLYAVPIPKLQGVVNVGQLAAETLFSSAYAGLISLVIILAVASGINATLLACSRIFYAMAEDGIFWSFLKKLHPRHRTPYGSILTQGLLAAGMVLWGSFDQLLGYVVLIMLVSSMATGLAHLTLRARRPALSRPYRTWGYPLTPLLFIGAYGWIAWQISWEKPQTSLLGLVIALSGLPFYFFWARKLKRANP